MGLEADAKARRALARGRDEHAILITLVGNYGLPGDVLVAEQRPVNQVAHDPDLVLLGVLVGVPVYALRRIADYTRWRPLRLTAHGLGHWSTLAVERAGEVRRDMIYWQRTHPGLSAHLAPHSPAA